MMFTIARLGPVRRAEIDLGKDLLLLTGPNGAGKTHVAWAVYEFLQAWRAATGPEHRLAAHALLADPALQGALTTVADHLLVSRDSTLDRVELLQEHGQHLFDLIARRCVTLLADDIHRCRARFRFHPHRGLRVRRRLGVRSPGASAPPPCSRASHPRRSTRGPSRIMRRWPATSRAGAASRASSPTWPST